MSKSSKIEIAGLILAISRLSAAGKSAPEIQTYFECEQLLEGTSPSSEKSTIAKPARRKRRKNRTLAILQFLNSQGKKGAHIKAIAEGVGTKPANITAWIYSSGKQVKELKKVKPATYALIEK